MRWVVFVAITSADAKGQTPQDAARKGLLQTVGELAARKDFLSLVQQLRRTRAPTQPAAKPMKLPECPAGNAKPLPGGVKHAFAATVMIQAGARKGSGVIVSPAGYVLTAAHVVESFASVKVKLHAGMTLTAKVVAVDRAQDVALVRAPGSGYVCVPPYSGSDDMIGQEVYAIGSPVGLEFSITKGILSGHRTVRGHEFIQTDAGLNPGNSGGPVLSQQGALLGVVSWKILGLEGLAFAAPVAAALQRLNATFQSATPEPQPKPPAPPPEQPAAAPPAEAP